MVTKLTAVDSGNAQDATSDAAALRLNLARSFERDVLLELERHLLEKYDPSTNQTVIDNLVAQNP